MSDATRAILSSWTIEFWPTACCVAALIIYWRGWRGRPDAMAQHIPPWRAAAFAAGVVVCWVAIASPLDALSGLLLQAHMVQHILLMMIGPPLILLGCPGIPMLRGLPPTIRRDWVGPFIASRRVRTLFSYLTHPVVCWSLLVAATWIWHLPACYELALRSAGWHEVEHAVFLGTALLFWWPVVQPWPSRAVWPKWMLLPYLLAADLQNTLFSAIFVFRDTPIYGAYAAHPDLLGIGTVQDQEVAGAIMWVAGSAAFLVPLGVIVKKLLQPRLALAGVGGPTSVALPIIGGGGGGALPRGTRPADLLRTPLLGRILTDLRIRRVVQGIMLAAAAMVVIDGLLGPHLSPMNLAGVLPWTHWRGLVVIALLVAGNAFCWACPFMLPRELGKRLFLPTRRWPKALRNKWLAATLLLVYLWAYEVFGLWDSPWWTAWVVIGYFAAALVVDSFFRGAAFCRWICPIGQFHFVEALISPREVGAIDQDTCRSCTTRDCIRGGPSGRGCELDLYIPTKRGNLDCTFCMDCVRACPHENVGLTTRRVHVDSAYSGWRGSIGRMSGRLDIAAIAALLTFGAFANAAGMVGPILSWEDAVAASIGAATPLIPATVVLLGIGVAAPLALIPPIAAWARRTGEWQIGLKAMSCRLSLALVPIGFAMWLVHMLFHFLTGLGTIVPVTQRIAADAGLNLGEPAWAMACCLAVPDWLLPLELLLLDAGLILTVVVLHRVARSIGTHRSALTTAILSIPAVLLFAFGVWLVLQPMQMRGTILP